MIPWCHDSMAPQSKIMKIISIISQKGGVGKTTLAVNLAIAVSKAGLSAGVVDLDPQASAATWSDVRQNGNDPAVISAQYSRLPQILETAKEHDTDYIFIDTAARSQNAALAAARSANLILIPCKPAFLDLQAIKTTVDLALLAKTPIAIILNDIPSRGTLPEEAKQVLEKDQLTISPVTLGHRTAFVRSTAMGQGVLEYEPSGKAALEITNLFKWLANFTNNSEQKG